MAFVFAFIVHVNLSVASLVTRGYITGTLVFHTSVLTATRTAIDESNRLYYSPWRFLLVPTAAITSSQNGLHGYQ